MIQPNATFPNHVHAKRNHPRAERWLLQQAFKSIGPAPIRLALRLDDDSPGEALSPPGVLPAATIVIRDLGVLAHMAVDPEVAFGDAYSDGRIDIEGDLAEALTVVYQSWPTGRADHGIYQQLTSKWAEWRQSNTLQGSRHNISRHYDLGNDFYKLWLDRQMVYTCAYFPTPEATLEEAQEAKLDYVCRKLRLQPGERVAEAGCGWGALALHMARHYGVTVKAYNISHEQIAYARERAAAEGLSSRVEFIEDDYRNISGSFDVFASVGMLEHVGENRYAGFGDVIHRAIGDTGRGLIHFIGRSHKGEFSRWIRKRIFPGAYAPTLMEAMEALEPYDYSVFDIENLRPHYAKTLEHWLARFEQSGDEVLKMYSPWFQRAWRLYLAGSIAAFRAGTLQLFQVTFSGSKYSSIPWTREGLYANTAHDPVEEQAWNAATS